MSQIHDQADSYEFHREMMERQQEKDDELKESLTDEQVDIIQDYYFAEYASHNEDFAGFDNYFDGLTYDECLSILKKENE